jgi:hypothetical protein
LRTRDIAARAGVNIATLHYYFATKEDLIRAVVRMLLEKFTGAPPGEAPATPEPPLDEMRQELADVIHQAKHEPERYVVVTQRKVGDDTTVIAKKAPRTWHYLNSHRGRFEARKSSIYSSRMPFALFGIGDYTFAPWKVAVSGLHRTARFSLVGSFGNKPVLFDDTCYFLPFDDEQEARVVASILNSPPCQKFLSSLVFTDSKRPITVELLQRLNIHAIAVEAGIADEWFASRNQPDHRPEQQTSLQAEFVMERPMKGV